MGYSVHSVCLVGTPAYSVRRVFQYTPQPFRLILYTQRLLRAILYTHNMLLVAVDRVTQATSL
jgi:hypothetical protein